MNRVNFKRHIPENIRYVSKGLGMTYQPNKGSSFYKLPPKDKIPTYQRGWDTPIGTWRLSDHWNYVNNYGELVYNTDSRIPEGKWALCVNVGVSPAWRVLKVFYSTNSVISVSKIKEEIENYII